MKKLLGIAILSCILFTTACGQTSQNTNVSIQKVTEENTAAVEAKTKISEETESGSQITAPAKEQVLEKRKACLAGMSDQDIKKLTENVKAGNLKLETAYMHNNIFQSLSDPDDLKWNYIDHTGSILIGYAFDEGKEYQKSSGMSYEEYAIKYGTEVKAYNQKDADDYIALMKQMKDSIHDQGLQKDFDTMITCMQKAKETHDVRYLENIYYMLHDMDYFLLRYGPEDVGKYTQNVSTVCKYYGVLSVYQ